ncbi:hypothetical protein KPH14_001054 [Odynerus spinipes]|uniref:TELO2-interacting protein 2 n=1 Tax=Odynerus spinipes TaxID=1348599 RepID=A0AAD9VIX8_9HYME|nr:hypothetical protein KPH14_001054 [Odynerus spinipes]
MDNLMRTLEGLQISGNIMEQGLWSGCIDLIEKSFVPQKQCGNERLCEEKDFREYRIIVDRNLSNIKFMLQRIIQSCNEGNVQIDIDNILAKTFAINLIYLIGEHHEKSIWNTAESVSTSKELIAGFCQLYRYENISQFLIGNNNLSMILERFRYKLQRDSWKTYPSAVTWYKWILQLVEKPTLYDHIHEVLPTALIIVDDYIPENVVIGLECLYQIIHHSYMKKGLIDTGYADVIYHALERLTHQREVRYVVPLHLCLTSLLATMEHWSNNLNVFEWTRRDDVLATLLDNMELEQDVELRHAYILSLPQLLTNIGCAKWCERITRILSEYCEHHTDLRTLKATLETAKTYLVMFNLRVAAHCIPLYTAFLKLHFDLTETPIFDMEIMQNLEDCICLLYKLTPSVGGAIMRDDRMRLVIKSKLQVQCLGDIKYFE